MPKIVDHEQRRAEIARALWRLAAREGLTAVSARSVAAEAGWSLGAIRHYFSTQDDLLRFAGDSMLAAVTERITPILQTQPPGVRRCQQVLEQLLPLDEQRLGEVRAWLALLVSSRSDSAITELRRSGWAAERHLCRWAVAELSGSPPPDPESRLDHAREESAATLHALVDGITMQAATVPEEFPAAAQRAALRKQLDEISASVT